MTSLFLFLAQTTTNDSGSGFLKLGAFALVLAIAAGIFWIWMLVDALTNSRLDSTMKIVWAAIIFFFPFLGALVYLILGRRGPAARPV